MVFNQINFFGQQNNDTCYYYYFMRLSPQYVLKKGCYFLLMRALYNLYKEKWKILSKTRLLSIFIILFEINIPTKSLQISWGQDL